MPLLYSIPLTNAVVGIRCMASCTVGAPRKPGVTSADYRWHRTVGVDGVVQATIQEADFLLLSDHDGEKMLSAVRDEERVEQEQMASYFAELVEGAKKLPPAMQVNTGRNSDDVGEESPVLYAR
jgi:hypothetical protein